MRGGYIRFIRRPHDRHFIGSQAHGRAVAA
jgi:hypothetical protein